MSSRVVSIQFGHVANAVRRVAPRFSILMRAAVLRAFGSPSGFSMDDWPDPLPADGEVLVRVANVCVNRTDVHVIERTNIGRMATVPHVGGLDPAGTVVAHGPGVSASAPAVGARVVARPMIPCLACRFCATGEESACERPSYIGVHRPGGFAELVALPVRALFAVPDGLDFAAASATAHSVPIVVHLLESVGGVGPGDRVLVLGAAGGLGMAAIRLARHLGADVIAAASTEEKLAAAVAAGARAGVSTAETGGFADRVKAETGGFGVTVAVDNVGDRALWPEVVAALDKGGRILSCGSHAGGRVELDMNVFYRMQLRLLSTAGTSADEFRRALALAAAGVVPPAIHDVRPLPQITAAFEDLLARRNTGKIVLAVPG